MLRLYGKEKLYQWDTNQKVEVLNKLVKEVHFSNIATPKALVVEVVDGFAEVPNILLTQGWDIKAWGYCGECTRVSATFEVIERQKPEDYVYEETEVRRYEDLEKRIEKLEQGGNTAELEARLEELEAEQAQIEEALDSILAIEYELIGGNA